MPFAAPITATAASSAFALAAQVSAVLLFNAWKLPTLLQAATLSDNPEAQEFARPSTLGTCELHSSSLLLAR